MIKQLSATLTRPANTTAYTIGDVIGPAAGDSQLVLDFGAPKWNEGYIVGVRLVTSKTDFASTVRIWFYTAAPSSIPADNAAMTLLTANKSTRVGYVDITLGTQYGSNDCAEGVDNSIRIPFAASSQYLYAVLQEKSGGTPASGQTFHLYVQVDKS